MNSAEKRRLADGTMPNSGCDEEDDGTRCLGPAHSPAAWGKLLRVVPPPPPLDAATDVNAFYGALAFAQSAYAPTSSAIRFCLEAESLLYAAYARRESAKRGQLSAYVGQDGLLAAGCIGVGKSRTIQLLRANLPQPIHHPASSAIRGPWVQVPVAAVSCPDKASKLDLYDEMVRTLAKPIGLVLEENRLYRRHHANDLYVLFLAIAAEHKLGLLIVDEIQNISAQKGGGAEAIKNNLVRLTQETGVAIMTVGTPPACKLMESSGRSARRFAERFISWDPYGRRSTDWRLVAEVLWGTRALSRDVAFSEGVADALWDASQGVASFAQILLGGQQREDFGKEALNLEDMVKRAPDHPLIGTYVSALQKQWRYGPEYCEEPEVQILGGLRARKSTSQVA